MPHLIVSATAFWRCLYAGVVVTGAWRRIGDHRRPIIRCGSWGVRLPTIGRVHGYGHWALGSQRFGLHGVLLRRFYQLPWKLQTALMTMQAMTKIIFMLRARVSRSRNIYPRITISQRDVSFRLNAFMNVRSER